MAINKGLLSVGTSLALGVTAPALGNDGFAPKCDDSLRAAFRPEDQTTITLIRLFKAGESVKLGDGTTGGGSMVLLSGPPATAQVDLCLVKLRVGPGNPGPEGAPSTSAGIGMEIWLPSPVAWNGRIHNMGGGGWVGGDGADPKVINWSYVIEKANVEHSVTSMQDTGHTGNGGAFAMLPDGTPNRRLWEDFAARGLHEQTLKTKALTHAFTGGLQNSPISRADLPEGGRRTSWRRPSPRTTMGLSACIRRSIGRGSSPA